MAIESSRPHDASMLLLIPYEIETLQQERPWSNWLIVATCTIVSLFALFGGGFESGMMDPFILNGFSITGLFGHIFLHVDLLHLIGNMIFLWVFGNAICANIGNGMYLLTFLGCTLTAAIAHLIFDGDPAIGASGAINGIVGVTLAMYPLNRVYLLWVFMIRGGSTACKARTIIIAWFFFDIWGVMSGGGSTAYWAHIGGFLGGLALGLFALHRGWIELTEYDNQSLLEIIRREPVD